MRGDIQRADGSGADPVNGSAPVRVAAVGDVHFGCESRGSMRAQWEGLSERADVLLLAGDLTQHGLYDEARVLAEEVAGLGVPVVAVLGNHDYHKCEEDRIRRVIEDAGVTVLEGESIVLYVRGRRVGIAGVKGFGGGFAGACGSEFGEEEMKAFIRHTKTCALALREHLRAIADCEVRIALTHYAPSKTTLVGERLEIYAFLGSYLLGEAIDQVGCHLAVHGHAHLGTEHGVTSGGVTVRNVAQPVIRHAYNLYLVGSRDAAEPASPEMPVASSAQTGG